MPVPPNDRPLPQQPKVFDRLAEALRVLHYSSRTERTSARVKPGRHHVDPTILQRLVKTAATRLGIVKPVTCHTQRHSFATSLLEHGYNIRTIQGLLGPKDVKTTMIYTHVLNRGGKGVRSPVGAL